MNKFVKDYINIDESDNETEKEKLKNAKLEDESEVK